MKVDSCRLIRIIESVVVRTHDDRVVRTVPYGTVEYRYSLWASAAGSAESYIFYLEANLSLCAPCGVRNTPTVVRYIIYLTLVQ